MQASEIAQTLGKRGGCARAAALTPQQRSASATKAARARWGKPKPSKRKIAAA